MYALISSVQDPSKGELLKIQFVLDFVLVLSADLVRKNFQIQIILMNTSI